MNMELRTSGNDGIRAYAEGDTYEGDSEWARRMLINGLATPIDDAARTIASSPHQVERYRSDAMIASARALGISDSDIPAAPPAAAPKSKR